MTRMSLFALVLSACFGTPNPQEATEGPAPESTEVVVTYTCPMHPEVTSTDPEATCPICGMALSPQGGQEHGSHGHDDAATGPMEHGH